VQVGLDFGTSTTKVMYRKLEGGDRQARLLNFNHDLPDYPEYCLPSLATFDRRGNLFLGELAAKRTAANAWGAGLSRLKMLVAGKADVQYLDSSWYDRFREHVRLALGDDSECTPEALSATYLAAVMRRVRVQLQHELGSGDLDLIFNTCVPVDQSERTPVVRSFECVIATAAELEREQAASVPVRAWLARAMQRIPEIAYDVEDDGQRIFLMPEAVATAAGYVTSMRRRSGLHAIVDIGAGTTDVSIFLLTLARKAGAATYWYAARSIPIGAARIEGMLAAALGRHRQVVTRELIHHALGGDAELAPECGTLVKDELCRMWNGTLKAWAAAYGHNASQSAWTRGAVTVFLTGGGAQIPVASEVFARSWMTGWGPYPCSVIPIPESFDRKSRAQFCRLSVAFGLATPLPELGQQVMPSRSPDHTPARPPIRSWRQDGDQLLPRWGWT
jgi:hypothetical protein